MNDNRETDLFGNPVRARKGLRGRPAKELTEKDLDALESGLAQGWAQERIAKTLNVGLSTLKRNFGPVLKTGQLMPDRLQLQIFAVTVRKALEGDMGAVRQVRLMQQENERLRAEERFRKGGEEGQEKAPPIGKKEAARRAGEKVTETSDGSWGDLLNPSVEIH